MGGMLGLPNNFAGGGIRI